METRVGKLPTFACTVFALAAFAANSVLCRLALSEPTIDAASFSTIRLVSGAATLLLIAAVFKARSSSEHRGKWASASFLFFYAVPFSFAYVSLSTGTGALILFGAVQVTMILATLWAGESPHFLEWLGLSFALVGLTYLVFPGLTAPSLTGSVLMAGAGISWGIYSLRGRGAVNPLAETTDAFVRALPFVVGVSLIALPDMHVSLKGAYLAVLSGALASGVGYSIWYTALGGLTITRAATVQLSVPVLAAVGGVIFLSEDISMRLLLSAAMVLGGVGLSLVGRERLAGFRATERQRPSVT